MKYRIYPAKEKPSNKELDSFSVVIKKHPPKSPVFRPTFKEMLEYNLLKLCASVGVTNCDANYLKSQQTIILSGSKNDIAKLVMAHDELKSIVGPGIIFHFRVYKEVQNDL